MNTDFLNPKFIRYFLKGYINFLSAGKDLNISQPSLTRAVQILETNLKKKLFLRSKKGVKLTKEGRYFILMQKQYYLLTIKYLQTLMKMKLKKKKPVKKLLGLVLHAT